VLGEPHALASQPIDVRRPDLLVTVTAEHPGGQLVGNHQHDVGTRRGSLLLRRRRGFRLVRTRGDQRPPKGNLVNRWLHCRAADAVVATNSAMARRLADVFGLPAGRLALILGGVDAEAFAFVRGLRHVHAVAVGVKSREELLVDIALLEGRDPPAGPAAAVGGRGRRLFIEEHCQGCGRCVEACRYGALALVRVEGPKADQRRLRVEVDLSRCVLCGYCAAACRDFYIKVV